MIKIQNFTDEVNLKNQGVYMITHVNTDLRYVGSTYSKHGFAGRWRAHLNGFLRGKGNKVLLNVYRKYGIDNFKFHIIESLTDEKLIRQREQYWIIYYDTFNNGANCTLDTDCAFNNFKREPYSEEQKETYRRTSPSRKTVYVYNEDGELCFTFNSSVECDRYFNLKKGRTNWRINHPLRSINKIYYPSYELKEWCPKEEKILIKKQAALKTANKRIKNNSYQVTGEHKKKIRASHKTKISVALYNLNDNHIQDFISMNECDNFLNLTKGSTSKVLKGKVKTLKRKYIPKIIC